MGLGLKANSLPHSAPDLAQLPPVCVLYICVHLCSEADSLNPNLDLFSLLAHISTSSLWPGADAQ